MFGDQRMVRIGLINIGIGAALIAIGVGITIVSFLLASGGGTYVVAYGAIGIGIWRLLLGLIQLSGALVTPVLMGIVLIAQTPVDTGYLVNQLVQSSDELSNPTLLIRIVILPAVLIVGSIAGGILAVRHSPVAGGFCLVLCALGLLYALYNVGEAVYFSVIASPEFSWLDWTLMIKDVAIYSAGLTVFARLGFRSPWPAAKRLE
jgi:hypothetical protein